MILDVVRNDFGSAIVPVANGDPQRVMAQTYTTYFPGTIAPNATPMVVDLSGLKAIIQFSYNF